LNALLVVSEKGSPDTKLSPPVLLRGDVVDGNPLLDDEFSHGATVDRWRAVNAAGRIQPANFTCETAGWKAILKVRQWRSRERLVQSWESKLARASDAMG
jgi:hypothetical protein